MIDLCIRNKTMKTITNIPKLNFSSLPGFIKLNIAEQSTILKQKGLFIDQDTENNKLINLYYIDGFFVEEIMSMEEKRVLEIIPFRQGYKVEKYFEIKEVLSLKSIS